MLFDVVLGTLLLEVESPQLMILEVDLRTVESWARLRAVELIIGWSIIGNILLVLNIGSIQYY